MASRAIEPTPGMRSRPSAHRLREIAPASWDSMIPLASSDRSPTVDCRAKTAVIIAIITMRRESMGSMPVPPANLAKGEVGSSRSVPIASMIEPNMSAVSTMASVHPMMGPRWSRSPRPSGVPYRAGASAGPGRSETNPAPRSRRASMRAATTRRSAASATRSASGHHRFPAKGCICSPQPIGEAHVSAPSPRSPAIRTM